MRNIIDLSRKLRKGTVKSRELVEACLERISDEAGQGKHAFLTVYQDRALDEAGHIDSMRHKGWSLPQFAGIPISIKDLFDVEGEVTRAGSRVLDTQPPAAKDAAVIQRLRNAGFVIIGKTNMTEFAYSGLGINAHFGTPLNPFERDKARIPGGSTSGGAVSVADGMAAATIGTDTGGTCRIPAAFCGIVGLKTTSYRVPRDGAVPLSRTLDSIGPLANSVSCCAVLDSILSGGQGEDVESFPEGGLRIGVLEGYVTEKLDEGVARTYQAALTRLSQKGVRLQPVSLDCLNELPHINRNGGLVGADAYAWHKDLLETRSEYYDPWVRARFDAGRAQSAADYIELLDKRQKLQKIVQNKTNMYDALVLPAVQITPPTIESLADTKTSNETNLLCLRNAAVGNFLNRPAISVPCHEPGEAPVGLMLMGQENGDRHLLSIARGLEYAIRPGH
ncbi:MAG: hypothetical protein K8F25_06975 [Fimbriimonadaceae bacterium]|nr:hypothetical protein [Alphaproteobacteria bacterium]